MQRIIMTKELEWKEWNDFKKRNPNGTVWDYLNEGSTECDQKGKPIKEIPKAGFFDNLTM